MTAQDILTLETAARMAFAPTAQVEPLMLRRPAQKPRRAPYVAILVLAAVAVALIIAL